MQASKQALVYQPRKDGWLSLPGWLTHSGHFDLKWSHVNYRSGKSGKVRQPKTDVITTEPQPTTHPFRKTCSAVTWAECHFPHKLTCYKQRLVGRTHIGIFSAKVLIGRDGFCVAELFLCVRRVSYIVNFATATSNR